MNHIRKNIKNLIEQISGYQIEQLEYKSFVLYPRNSNVDIWFSQRAQVMSIIEKFGVDLIIDVGANAGQFGSHIRQFYNGEILSLEPVSSAFKKLVQTASLDPRWHVQKVALGSRDSTATINISDQTVFSSILETNLYCSKQFGAVHLL